MSKKRRILSIIVCAVILFTSYGHYFEVKAVTGTSLATTINNLYNGEDSLYNKLKNNSIILFDNIEKCNLNILDNIIRIIDEKRIKDKVLDNSIVFLSATNKVSFGIGFSNESKVSKYNNNKTKFLYL